MSLSIHTNAVQMSALRSLSMAAEYTKAAEARLATGRNIVDAYTDGAAFAVSIRIDTNVKAINAVNERLNATKDSIYRTTEGVSVMSSLTAQVRKTLVKLADTSLVGVERENYEVRYKRYAAEILDHYNGLMKDGTSLVSDGEFYNSIYTAPHKVVSNVDGRQTTIGDWDPTGGSLTLSGFTDPDGTAGARNKEDIAQAWRQVFLDTGQDLVQNGQGFPSEQQVIPTPDAARAAAMIDDSGSSPYRLSQLEDSLSRVMNGLFKDLRSVENYISFNNDIAAASEGGLGAIQDADMTKESARFQAFKVRQEMARQGLAIVQASNRAVLSLLV
ncbi:flagellin [Skermanella mucosa]|uniref:flagellin n=1 Tax=Skermanella mucosa TaxID=1789672 RepID=UPI00192C098F|nr:flagellin [Skermanella mucosa]UEM21443.1 flagellin [Skermanella mucosa]